MHASSASADEVVGLAHDLIRFDTSNFGSNDSSGERDAAEYVAAKLDEVGIDSELYESQPMRTTLVARWEPDGCDLSIPPLLVHMHLDVVPAIASDWSVDPFAGEVIDGYLWGRGAVDMKDMDAMVLSVIRDRVRSGRPPRRPIRLVFTADEEAGGVLGSGWLVKHHPETVSDCTEAIGEVGGFSLTVRDDLRLYLIQTAEKGLAWLNLVARGQAGHGSMRNDDNAITRLAQAVARIGAYQWPERIHPAQQLFLDTIEDVLDVPINLDTVEETLDRLGTISRMVGATMSNTANPTMLQAGYKVNVVPGQAVAGVDGRFIPGCRDEFFDTIKELAGELVDCETVTEAVAVETEYAGALVDAIQICLAAEDPYARAVPYLLSAGTDAKAWSQLGIRCFGFTPLQLPPDLDFSALFHGVDERIPVDSLKFGCRVLDRFFDLA